MKQLIRLRIFDRKAFVGIRAAPRRRCEQGATLLELLLGLPLLILLIFGAIMFNDHINQKQVVGTLLRGASVPAVQNCYRSLLAQRDDAQICLENWVLNATRQGKELAEDFSILVSVYSQNGAAPVLKFQVSSASSAWAGGNMSSRFDRDTVGAKFPEILAVDRMLTIVEVFKRDNSSFMLFKERFFGSSNVLYDVALF